jgi:hypothetical protein
MSSANPWSCSQHIEPYISGVECLNSSLVATYMRCKMWICVEVQRWDGSTHATLMCLIASSSPRTHSCHLGSPYCMVPKMILETLSPDCPRRTVRVKSMFKLQRVSFSESGLTVGHLSDKVGICRHLSETTMVLSM